MSGQEQWTKGKYSYKFTFEPAPPGKGEATEVDKRELQAYIDKLLGVPSRRKVDSAPSTT